MLKGKNYDFSVKLKISLWVFRGLLRLLNLNTLYNQSLLSLYQTYWKTQHN